VLACIDDEQLRHKTIEVFFHNILDKEVFK